MNGETLWYADVYHLEGHRMDKLSVPADLGNLLPSSSTVRMRYGVLGRTVPAF